MGAAYDAEATRFASEWRQDVMQAFRDQTQINKDVTKALSELTVAVGTLKTSVDDMRKSPDLTRNMFGTYGGCIGQAVFACFYVLSLGISITALIVTLAH